MSDLDKQESEEYECISEGNLQAIECLMQLADCMSGIRGGNQENAISHLKTAEGIINDYPWLKGSEQLEHLKEKYGRVKIEYETKFRKLELGKPEPSKLELGL